MSLTLGEIAASIGAEVLGDAQTEISGLGSLGTAVAGEISHLSSASYRHLLAATQASAVIVKAEDVDDCPVSALVVANPYLAFAKVSQLFVAPENLATGIHPSAVVGARTQIDPSAAVGAGVVIGEDSVIGPGVRVFPNAVIGDRCRIGEQVTIRANVTFYNDVSVGPRSVFHSGCIIGADGFGFTPDAQGHLQAIAQLGGVEIGADVSIGASSTIDCGAIENTVVEDGVKIDNQVQIGHNSRIGAHSLLCGCVGVAGSSVIGKHCMLAGGSGVGGDKPVTLCDGVIVSACTTITQSVSKPGVYSGSIVFHEHNAWRRNALRFTGLDKLFKRVAKLESQFSQKNDL
jgi:UDP-3-O-[3-hydroxymyristoyl] glucosamine N-acyltransferase